MAIELICTDAAANELLSADILKSEDGLWKSDELAAALPTLAKCGHVLRDASHAKRRVVSRGSRSSTKLRHVAQHFGQANWSLAQKLQHSRHIRSVLKRNVKQVAKQTKKNR